jgi:hypothetical protein
MAMARDTKSNHTKRPAAEGTAVVRHSSESCRVMVIWIGLYSLRHSRNYSKIHSKFKNEKGAAVVLLAALHVHGIRVPTNTKREHTVIIWSRISWYARIIGQLHVPACTVVSEYQGQK